ncbi:MAG TPA: ester cyclase [Actinomycetota bacterium]|nr:ester cyclase [Actinomycetota bacterium]
MRPRKTGEVEALVGFPDATWITGVVVEQGNTLADEFTFVGTHTGPFLLPDGTELPPTGKRVEIKAMDMVQVCDGKFVIDNLYSESMAVLVGLGLARMARPRDRVVMS